MGNRTGYKKHPTSDSPATMVVEVIEVGALNGCVTLRCGPALRHVDPALLALPYEGVPDLPAKLEELARAAEKDYWPLMEQVLRTTPGYDPLALAQAMERCVRARDWSSAAAMAPRDELRLFHCGGHVAVQVAPPFSRRPLRLIFDPLQLHRLHDSFEVAVANARGQLDASSQAVGDERARATLVFLARAPWAPHDELSPAPEEAGQVMRQLRDNFLQRVPYQTTATNSTTTPPAETHWTPLLHPCGCTIDWGWDTGEMDPNMFIEFCLQRHTLPCPWHAANGPASLHADASRPLRVRCPSSGRHTWARPATGDNVELGADLTRQLTELADTLAHTDPHTLAAGLPPWWCDLVAQTGDDPVRAWTEQRRTDIILHRGGDTLGRLTALEVAAHNAGIADTAPIEDDCGAGITARAIGGILCECGHDWSCHPGASRQGEPCNQCPCPDMRPSDEPMA